MKRRILGALALVSLMATVAYAQKVAQDASPPIRHLTLDEAQRVPVQANAALARLGELSIEAAEHHRKAVAADYFPKVSAAAWNLHFNEFLGQRISIVRPIAGTTLTTGVPLFGQDQSFVAFNAIQPLTPIFKVRQAVNLARADENIARGLPVPRTPSPSSLQVPVGKGLLGRVVNTLGEPFDGKGPSASDVAYPSRRSHRASCAGGRSVSRCRPATWRSTR